MSITHVYIFCYEKVTFVTLPFDLINSKSIAVMSSPMKALGLTVLKIMSGIFTLFFTSDHYDLDL